jgi:hypothetical protein
MEDNIVAANNVYDYEYLKYFTPLTNSQIMYLPNLCNYVDVKYNPTKLNQFLLAPVRPKIHPRLTKDLNDYFLNLIIYFLIFKILFHMIILTFDFFPVKSSPIFGSFPSDNCMVLILDILIWFNILQSFSYPIKCR